MLMFCLEALAWIVAVLALHHYLFRQHAAYMATLRSAKHDV